MCSPDDVGFAPGTLRSTHYTIGGLEVIPRCYESTASTFLYSVLRRVGMGRQPCNGDNFCRHGRISGHTKRRVTRQIVNWSTRMCYFRIDSRLWRDRRDS